ncbi:MAG: tetratricopeptide repeat protein [Gammaproteobacteria bacterium]
MEEGKLEQEPSLIEEQSFENLKSQLIQQLTKCQPTDDHQKKAASLVFQINKLETLIERTIKNDLSDTALKFLESWQEKRDQLYALKIDVKALALNHNNYLLCNLLRINLLLKVKKPSEAYAICLQVLKEIQSDHLHDPNDEIPFIEAQMHWPSEHDSVLLRCESLKNQKLYPDYVRNIQDFIGYIYFYRRDYAKAEEVYNKMLWSILSLKEPGDYDIYSKFANQSLANVYYRQGKYSQALTTFKLAEFYDKKIIKKPKVKNFTSCCTDSYPGAPDVDPEYFSISIGIIESQLCLSLSKRKKKKQDTQKQVVQTQQDDASTEDPVEHQEITKNNSVNYARKINADPFTHPVVEVKFTNTSDDTTSPFVQVTTRQAQRLSKRNKSHNTTSVVISKLQPNKAHQTAVSGVPSTPQKNSNNNKNLPNYEIKVENLTSLLTYISAENNESHLLMLDKKLNDSNFISQLHQELDRIHTRHTPNPQLTNKYSSALQSLWGTKQVVATFEKCLNLTLLRQDNLALSSLFQIIFPEWEDMKKFHVDFRKKIETLASVVWSSREDRSYQMALLFLQTHIRSLTENNPLQNLPKSKVLGSKSANVLKVMLGMELFKKLSLVIEKTIQEIAVTMPIPKILKRTIEIDSKSIPETKSQPTQNPHSYFPTVVEVVQPEGPMEILIANAASEIGCLLVRDSRQPKR